MSIIRIITYSTDTGQEPFTSWLDDLDMITRSIVIQRLGRVRLGNFGDCKSIKNAQGIMELRINYGSGYRIYFAREGINILILLLGGDKKSQSRDITKAKKYWIDYKDKDKR